MSVGEMLRHQDPLLPNWFRIDHEKSHWIEFVQRGGSRTFAYTREVPASTSHLQILVTSLFSECQS